MSALRRMRDAASRAAERVRERAEEPVATTRRDLERWAREQLGAWRIVVVSNREPYSHHHRDGGIEWVRNAGGLTVALDAAIRATGGVWVAHGSGDADRETVDARDHAACPPDRPRYTLRRVWLSDEDHRRYYAGFSNGGLWPLCHIVYVRPRFEREDWERYGDVNRRFADAVLEEVGDGPALVFLQDYHLARAAEFLRAARPDLRLAQFWHIPWPNAEVFRRLPWREEVLRGLLANDLLGFHVPLHAQNFMQTVADSLEARVDFERMSVDFAGRRTLVRALPIGVDAEEIGAMARSAATEAAVDAWRERLGLGDRHVWLGVDRLDYTKGIPERLEALERLYELHPELIRRLAFVQVGVPSRIELAEYRAVRDRTREIVERIHRRFAPGGGRLGHLIEDNLDFRQLVPLYAMADVCAVTALHDGMNLVAKEYVAASPDLEGALVLSTFTGAARELEQAWVVSPYDRDALAEAFHAALVEPAPARRERMRALRGSVLRRTVFDWAIDVLESAARLVPASPGAPERTRRSEPFASLEDPPIRGGAR